MKVLHEAPSSDVVPENSTVVEPVNNKEVIFVIREKCNETLEELLPGLPAVHTMKIHLHDIGRC